MSTRTEVDLEMRNSTNILRGYERKECRRHVVTVIVTQESAEKYVLKQQADETTKSSNAQKHAKLIDTWTSALELNFEIYTHWILAKTQTE